MLTVAQKALTRYPNKNYPPWEYTETSGVVMATPEIIASLIKLIIYLNCWIRGEEDGRTIGKRQ